MKITEPNDIVNLDKTCGEKRIKTIKSKKETNRSQQGGKENNTLRDIVNISSEATKIHQLKSMIEDIPDIRGNRVNTIKEKVESGGYQVDSDQTARAIIRENILDHLL